MGAAQSIFGSDFPFRGTLVRARWHSSSAGASAMRGSELVNYCGFFGAAAWGMAGACHRAGLLAPARVSGTSLAVPVPLAYIFLHGVIRLCTPLGWSINMTGKSAPKILPVSIRRRFEFSILGIRMPLFLFGWANLPFFSEHFSLRFCGSRSQVGRAVHFSTNLSRRDCMAIVGQK